MASAKSLIGHLLTFRTMMVNLSIYAQKDAIVSICQLHWHNEDVYSIKTKSATIALRKSSMDVLDSETSKNLRVIFNANN